MLISLSRDFEGDLDVMSIPPNGLDDSLHCRRGTGPPWSGRPRPLRDRHVWILARRRPWFWGANVDHYRDPSAASASAIVAPMPALPPVTKARLPGNPSPCPVLLSEALRSAWLVMPWLNPRLSKGSRPATARPRPPAFSRLRRRSEPRRCRSTGAREGGHWPQDGSRPEPP